MVTESGLIAAVRKAGMVVAEHAFSYGELTWKKKDDPVTSLDVLAERMIRKELTKTGKMNFVGEEEGITKANAAVTAYIDPIDGTKSFVRREFYCATSVGLEEKGSLFAGIVYDFMRDIMYVGFRGDRYILHQGKKQLLDTGTRFGRFKITVDDDPTTIHPMFAGMNSVALHRRGGSIALSLAHLASGAIDGIVIMKEGTGSAWDVAGGYYLLDPEKFVVMNNDGTPFAYGNPKKGILAYRRDCSPVIESCLRKRQYLVEEKA
jgi:myo-inositol-1(or 4)-monophosphatase